MKNILCIPGYWVCNSVGMSSLLKAGALPDWVHCHSCQEKMLQPASIFFNPTLSWLPGKNHASTFFSEQRHYVNLVVGLITVLEIVYFCRVQNLLNVLILTPMSCRCRTLQLFQVRYGLKSWIKSSTKLFFLLLYLFVLFFLTIITRSVYR